MGPSAIPAFALEGAVGSCAVGINWFRDQLGMVNSAPEMDRLAASVPAGAAGVYFVSAFGGLLAPRWRDDARGCLVGLEGCAAVGGKPEGEGGQGVVVPTLGCAVHP